MAKLKFNALVQESPTDKPSANYVIGHESH